MTPEIDSLIRVLQEENTQLKDTISKLQEKLEQWVWCGNEIMQCAFGKKSPLSDSDVCGLIENLKEENAQLKQEIVKWEKKWDDMLCTVHGRSKKARLTDCIPYGPSHTISRGYDERSGES